MYNKPEKAIFYKNPDWKILYYEHLESSQKEALRLLKHKILNSYDVILAEIQTNGHGRCGTHWKAEKGFLTFSFVIEKNLEEYKSDLSNSWFLKSMFAVKQVFQENYGVQVKIKWPNDWYVDDIKIGGIISNETQDYVILGIGLNLNKTTNKTNYGCIHDILGIKIEPLDFLSIFIPHFIRCITQFSHKYEMPAYITYDNSRYKIYDADSRNIYAINSIGEKVVFSCLEYSLCLKTLTLMEKSRP